MEEDCRYRPFVTASPSFTTDGMRVQIVKIHLNAELGNEMLLRWFVEYELSKALAEGGLKMCAVLVQKQSDDNPSAILIYTPYVPIQIYFVFFLKKGEIGNWTLWCGWKSINSSYRSNSEVNEFNTQKFNIQFTDLGHRIKVGSYGQMACKR